MITVQLATIPGREQSVKLTIASLLHQVDAMNVVFNNPDLTLTDEFAKMAYNYIGNKKINFIISDNSKGDAEKFHRADELKGYVLTCDDDLIYPDSYTETMIKHIEVFGGKAIVTLHGRVLKPGRITSYYSPSNRLQAFHCLHEVNGYHTVSSGGTGVMAWDANKVKIKEKWFKEPNMADVWVAVNARKHGIPIIVAPHNADWLLPGYDGPGIWDKHFNDDSIQTAAWNDEY